jgi:hypothetical protein
MFKILTLNLKGKSCYAIARELDMDPPTVYVSLKAAKKNFAEAETMLTELKALGWPIKLAEIQKEIRKKSPKERAEAKPTPEIAMKLG